ncbi:hypothetical protein ACWF0M_05160 [Kribbella sp. NPDC055110]
MSYRPSQPHGWPAQVADQPIGTTIGGHVTSKDFSHGGRSHRIRLLPDDPIHRRMPGADFTKTVQAAYGDHYAFRYLAGQRRLDVQSYSVYAREQADGAPLSYGADLYVVTAGTNLRWIQLAKTDGEWFVDSMNRANPFYLFGGATSIYGTRVQNLAYGAAMTVSADRAVPNERFTAEAFLVQDTRRPDAAGKEIIHVFNGITYGWEVGDV